PHTMTIRWAIGHRVLRYRSAASPARFINAYPGTPWTSIACASRARTCAVEYKAIGNAILTSILTVERQWRRSYMTEQLETLDLHATKAALIAGARALGFGHLGVGGLEISEDERHLLRWLDAGFQGEMGYMQRHGTLRSRPSEL